MTELLAQDQIDAFAAKAAAIAHPHELIVDMLRAIQAQSGWVPDAGVELTAQTLGVTAVDVEGIATFYDKIFRQPVGKRVIHLCDSICCWANGGDEIASHLQQSLGIAFGETTEDGVFTLLPTCCLGACGETPAMMIKFVTYGDLTTEKVDRVLAEIRKEVAA